MSLSLPLSLSKNALSSENKHAVSKTTVFEIKSPLDKYLIGEQRYEVQGSKVKVKVQWLSAT